MGANDKRDKKSETKAKGLHASVGINKDGMGVTIDALFKGLEGLVSSRTVIGEPIYIDDVKLIPLIEVSAGLASGALERNAKQNGAGAMSAKISPIAILIVKGGSTRLVTVKNQDVFTKLLDMIPDAIDRLTDNILPKRYEDEAEEKLKDMGVELITPEDPEDAEKEDGTNE